MIAPPAFEHPDVERIASEVEVGATTQSVLIVKTSLNLWRRSEEYQSDHVADLATAAKAYAARHGFDKVRFVSTLIV